MLHRAWKKKPNQEQKQKYKTPNHTKTDNHNKTQTTNQKTNQTNKKLHPHLQNHFKKSMCAETYIKYCSAIIRQNNICQVAVVFFNFQKWKLGYIIQSQFSYLNLEAHVIGK